MKTFKRLTALVLAFAVLACCLASCDNPGAGKEDPKGYIVNIKTSYATDDAKMEAAVAALQNSGATLSVLGDKIKVESGTTVGDNSVSESYILSDCILYHSTDVNVGEMSVSEKEKAVLFEESRDEVLSNLGVGADIDKSDFDECLEDTYGETTYYNCSAIKEDSVLSLEKIFASSFEGTGASVALEGAEYSALYLGELISESTLSCHYAITLDGVTYNVTMHMTYTYEYTNDVVILPPENEADYTYVSYDEIFK